MPDFQRKIGFFQVTYTDVSKMQEIRSEGSCKVTSEFLNAFDLAIRMVIELYNILERLVDC